MLITRGPLRVSLFGGGSDLPSYFNSNGGAVLSFAIDQSVYLVGHPLTHRSGVVLKYSATEDVVKAAELRHPIARVVLERYGVTDIDLAVMSDVPAGTGMGSSSSFTVALLAFVRRFCGVDTTSTDLAREACEIEVDVLKEPIGYQDQWASAMGGVNIIRFAPGEIRAERVSLGAKQVAALEANLHLVPIGRPRSASRLLAEQSSALTSGSQAEKRISRMVEMVEKGHAAMRNSIDDLGPLLNEAWQLKRELSHRSTNNRVDALYTQGLLAGATGGKLLGAGGSGYFAFYVPLEEHARFQASHPERLQFKVSQEGARVIHES